MNFISIRAYVRGDELRFAAETGPRFLWVDPLRERLLAQIEIPERRGFDVSPDWTKGVTGYWGTRGVDVWDLGTREKIVSFGPAEVSFVRFDPTSRYIAVYAESARLLYDLQTGRSTRLRYCDTMHGAALCHSTKSLLIPSTRKGRAIKVDGPKGKVSEISLGINARVWTMRYSRSEGKFLTISDQGYVACWDSPGGTQLWGNVYSGSEVDSFACFSADEQVVAYDVLDLRKTYVLDAATGTMIRVLDCTIGDAVPLWGSRVLTSSHHIVDLATGESDGRYADWRWWRKIGVQ